MPPARAERDAINTFLSRHNQRGAGSRTGYVAYYAAIVTGDEPLIDRIVGETGAAGMQDMGKVMKPLMVRLRGRADGKVANVFKRVKVDGHDQQVIDDDGSYAVVAEIWSGDDRLFRTTDRHDDN